VHVFAPLLRGWYEPAGHEVQDLLADVGCVKYVPDEHPTQLVAPPMLDKDHVHCDKRLLPVFSITVPSAPRTLTLSPAGPPRF